VEVEVLPCIELAQGGGVGLRGAYIRVISRGPLMRPRHEFYMKTVSAPHGRPMRPHDAANLLRKFGVEGPTAWFVLGVRRLLRSMAMLVMSMLCSSMLPTRFVWRLAITFLRSCRARCARRARRRRRIQRLRSLGRSAERVFGAFGGGEPCCICLDGSSPDGHGGAGGLIALLPCRHSLHERCYGAWLQSAAYPSPEDLLCPLCRRLVVAVGCVEPPEPLAGSAALIDVVATDAVAA